MGRSRTTRRALRNSVELGVASASVVMATARRQADRQVGDDAVVVAGPDTVHCWSTTRSQEAMSRVGPRSSQRTKRHQVRLDVPQPGGEHLSTTRPVTERSLRVLHQHTHGAESSNPINCYRSEVLTPVTSPLGEQTYQRGPAANALVRRLLPGTRVLRGGPRCGRFSQYWLVDVRVEFEADDGGHARQSGSWSATTGRRV